MKRMLGYLGAGIAALIAVLLGWGVLVEPRIVDAESYTVPLPGLAPGWTGRSIAVVSDLQVGMWGANTGTIRRISARLAEDRPAAVLLAGDFVYHASDDLAAQLAEVGSLLRPLTAAGVPVYAVLGNHDHSVNQRGEDADTRMAARVATALEEAGVTVLDNRAVALGGPGGDLYIVGIGSEWARDARPAEAFADVPPGAARVVFMHNPNSFPRIAAGAAPLAVAGHTHGGQVRVPGTPRWSWLDIVAEGEVHADGWILDEGFGQPGNRLYVNRGVGFSTLPIRINAPPEITYFRLEPAPAAGGGAG